MIQFISLLLSSTPRASVFLGIDFWVRLLGLGSYCILLARPCALASGTIASILGRGVLCSICGGSLCCVHFQVLSWLPTRSHLLDSFPTLTSTCLALPFMLELPPDSFAAFATPDAFAGLAMPSLDAFTALAMCRGTTFSRRVLECFACVSNSRRA